MCHDPHRRAAAKVVAGRVIVCLAHGAAQVPYLPPRGAEPREVETQSAELCSREQAGPQDRRQHAVADHRRRILPVWRLVVGCRRCRLVDLVAVLVVVVVLLVVVLVVVLAVELVGLDVRVPVVWLPQLVVRVLSLIHI